MLKKIFLLSIIKVLAGAFVDFLSQYILRTFLLNSGWILNSQQWQLYFYTKTLIYSGLFFNIIGGSIVLFIWVKTKKMNFLKCVFIYLLFFLFLIFIMGGGILFDYLTLVNILSLILSSTIFYFVLLNSFTTLIQGGNDSKNS